MKNYLLLFAAVVAGTIGTIPASATVVNFDAQAAGSGSDLTGVPEAPLTIGILTVTGGELLNQETGLGVDQTGVYASEGLFGISETNPLVLTFSTPVFNFSVFVANGDDTRAYTVTDNLGGSLTQTLASAGALGGATFSLSDGGITSVSISSANAAAWNFAIDNVTFTPTPEIGTGELSVLVAATLLLRRFRRA